MYKRQHKELMDVIYGRIDTIAGDDKILAKTMKERVYREMGAKGTLDVYFPLVREGAYKLSYNTKVKDANGNERVEPVFLMFDSEGERNAMYRIAVNDSKTEGKVTKPAGTADFTRSAFNNAPSGSFVSDILALLEKTTVEESVKEEVLRMFVSTLPETSFAKSLQGRNTVMGFVPDAALAMRKRGYQLSTQIVKMKNSARILALEEEAERIYKKGQVEGAKWSIEEKPRYEDMFGLVAAEMASRGKFARAGSEWKKIDKGAKIVNQIAFIYTIGFNASSAAVNLSQIPLVVIPYLAPMFGFDATLAAFGKASYSTLSNYNNMTEPYDIKEVSVVKNGVTQIEVQYTVKESEKKAIYALTKNKFKTLTKEQADDRIAELERYIPIVKMANSRGLINTTIDMEQAGVTDASGNKKTVAEQLVSLSSWGAASAFMFNSAEKFNRQTTLMASYDLILQQLNTSKRFKSGLQGEFIDVPKGEVAKAELAAAEAVYLTQETNGGAVLETTPSLIRSGIGRVAGMYKSFGMRMYSTMAKSVYQLNDASIDYSTAEGKALRRMALEQLASVSVTSILSAGIQGFPLYGLINMIMDFFSDDDEETFRTRTRKNVNELWYKGPLSYYTGVDISQRVSLTNLIFSENRYLNDPTDEELIAHYAGGAAWSTAKRVRRGVDLIVKEDEWKRGFEQLLPAGLNNAFRVLPKIGRFNIDDGMYTRKGQPIYAGLTTKDLVASGLGFPPVNYTFNTEEAAQIKSITMAVKDKRSKLIARYNRANRENDTTGITKASRNIQLFNDKWGEYVEITPKTLNDSIENTYKAQELIYKGVYIDSRLYDFSIDKSSEYNR